MPTKTNVHGDALCLWSWGLLCFKVWRLVAVGSGWRLAISGPWGLSLWAVLNPKKKKDLGS